MPTLKSRLVKMWNAFRVNEEPVVRPYSGTATNMGSGSSSRPHVSQSRFANERTIIAAIHNRLAIDVAAANLRHISLDEKGRYKETVNGSLQERFSLEANLDQGPRHFLQDLAMTLFEDGVAVIVPVDTMNDPETGEIVEFLNLRIGTVKEWYSKQVRVNLYNEEIGQRQDVLLDKRKVAIVENPFFKVMNSPNSTLQRIIRKLNLLDVVDEQSSSGKLDIIIQLPYMVKSESMRQRAEQRRQDIEFQLKGSQYGVAYADGTEKITQLNRPAENNLLKQVEYLMGLLYEQLGVTKAIMDGTAEDKTMINYTNRTIEPILDAIVEAMVRSFLGVKGIENRETIRYFGNPFKLVPLSEMAVIANSFSRNEILTANEIRDFIGVTPSDDPKADKLENSNMPPDPLSPEDSQV